MRICVFCSSRKVTEDIFDQATVFSQEMVRRKHGLVYGGGLEGLMGYFANEVLHLEGEVIGIFPNGLFPNEVAHTNLSQLIYVDDLMERKKKMMDMSDAFVVFPGGLGTLDEAVEVITWKSLNCFDKPIIFFNHEGYWNPFLNLLKEMQQNNMLHEGASTAFHCVHSVGDIFSLLDKAQ